MEPTRPSKVPADARWHPQLQRWEHGKLVEAVPRGPFQAFRGDGSLLFEGRFADGRLQGGFRSFHADGSVAREGTYERGALVGELTVHRGPGDCFPWADERSRRAVLRHDGEGQVTSTLELDERGREVIPGQPLTEREGSLDAFFREHGPEGFLAGGHFAHALGVLAPPTAQPRPDPLLLPVERPSSRPLTPERYQDLYGVPASPDLTAWLQAVAKRPDLADLVPDAVDLPGANVVETALLQFQRSPGLPGPWEPLVMGALPLATFHEKALVLGIYEGVNQLSNAVYPLEPREHSVLRAMAASLDDLAYLAALVLADRTRTLTRPALATAFERLRGRVDSVPEWSATFARALPDGTDGETEGDTGHDHREGFLFRRGQSIPGSHFFRGQWLGALLRGRPEAAYEAFLPDWDKALDASVAKDPQKFHSAVGARTSTGLYALLRAWVFQKPNLQELLDVAKASPALILRDCAALVGELRAGRTALGAVSDLEAVRQAFVALEPWNKKTGEEEEQG